MKIERRITTQAAPVKLEQRAEGEAPVIAGYAAVHYDGNSATEYELWDNRYERAVERVMPGAFTKALERKDDTACLFNHNPDLLLGRTSAGTVTLSVDGRGLRYECTPGDTSVAKDVVEHLKRGDVTGSSFAFTVDEERWTETKDDDGKWHSVREILSVTLYDVSPTTYPAYASTTAGVRSDGDGDEAKRSLEAHRNKARDDGAALMGRLAAYAARARAAGLLD